MANNSLFTNIATVLWATNISARKRRREPDLPRHLRSHLLANLQSNIEGKAKQVADLPCIALQSIPHVLFLLSCSLPLTRWRVFRNGLLEVAARNLLEDSLLRLLWSPSVVLITVATESISEGDRKDGSPSSIIRETLLTKRWLNLAVYRRHPTHNKVSHRTPQSWSRPGLQQVE